MSIVDKNIERFLEALKSEEQRIRQKANFCNEHSFSKEEEWLRMKLSIISEIRLEADLINSEKENRPRFKF